MRSFLLVAFLLLHPTLAAAQTTETTGTLRIAVNRPETEVFVDGRSVGTAPLDLSLPPGAHQLRLHCPQHRPWEGSVTITAGNRSNVRATLRPAPRRERAWPLWVTAGASVGLGIALGFASTTDRDGLERARQRGLLEDRDLRIDRGTALAVSADVLFILGAALAGVGTYLLFDPGGADSVARITQSNAESTTP